MDTQTLKILTESAKYDVSCSSSGSHRVNANGGLGNTSVGGICHSFTPDGRCISLLKILLSNDCIFNCEYCPNRAVADVERATTTPDDICKLVINFYKRNYIEGLFLSSAVFISPNHTMEMLYRTVYKLRKEYAFNGYIHLKGIPHADERITLMAAKLVDRMSYNIELPSEKSLKLLAPQKSKQSILLPMRQLQIEKNYVKENKIKSYKILPAGQTTQMIIGASPETDGQILRVSQALYRKMDIKRVYYSSYIPVVTNPLLPSTPTGLLREHRLYQADWLLRFYGFDIEELCNENNNLSLEYDPKCAWALNNMHLFPIEINKAPLELLLRVPGIGGKGAYRIIQARKHTNLTFEHLQKMKIILKRAKHFITCNGKFYGEHNFTNIKLQLSEGNSTQANNEQMSMFSTKENALTALNGQL